MKILFFFLFLAALPFRGEAAPPPSSNSTAPGSSGAVVWGEMPAGAKTAYIGIHGGTVPVSLLSAGDGSPMVAVVGLTGNDFVNFLRNNGKLQEELVLPDEIVTPDMVPLPGTGTGVSLPQIPPAVSVESAPILPSVVPSSSPSSPSGSSPEQASALPQIVPAGTDAAAQNTSGAPAPEIAQSPEKLPVPGANGTLRVAGTSAGDVPVIYATGSAFDRMSLIPSNWAPFGLTEKALTVEGEVKVLSTPKKSPRKSRRVTNKR